jgi:hypothetical protein
MGCSPPVWGSPWPLPFSVTPGTPLGWLGRGPGWRVRHRAATPIRRPNANEETENDPGDLRKETENRVVFRDPARGIKVGQHPYGIAQPLTQNELDQAIQAATTPVARLVLVLAAVHAVRKAAIITAQLEDVDLGNRRITLAGRTRPIDELTHQILLEWLDHRRTRWPHTANPHLIINQQTAMGTGPVTTLWGDKELRGQAATLERLRIDRQLEEALTHGPDPLHLAAVFGLDPKTAIRYAENARVLLVTTAEEQDPATSHEPKGRNGP